MKCKCKGLWFFITLCTIQLVTVVIRLVFDCLGLLWTPIVACLFHIVGTTLGIYGAVKLKYRFVAVYSCWVLLWIGWNIYLVCLFLEIGGLNVDEHIITLNLLLTNTTSWFKDGTDFICDLPGDNIVLRTGSHGTMTERNPCVIDYRHIEVAMSVLQIALACVGFILSCYVIGILEDEDYDEYDYMAANLTEAKRDSKEDRYYPRSHGVAIN